MGSFKEKGAKKQKHSDLTHFGFYSRNVQKKLI